MSETLDAEKFVRVLDHAYRQPAHFVRFNLAGLSDEQLAQVVKVCNTDDSFGTSEVCKVARGFHKRRLARKAREVRLEFLESEPVTQGTDLEFE